MRTTWYLAEEDFLIKNYDKLTIKELQKGLEEISHRKRSHDAINCKIKRLKEKGLISTKKSEDAIKRALRQRQRNLNEVR